MSEAIDSFPVWVICALSVGAAIAFVCWRQARRGRGGVVNAAPAPQADGREAGDKNRLEEVLQLVKSSDKQLPQFGGDNAEMLTNGIKCFMKERYDKAYEILLPLAEAGNPQAQSILAKLYFAGNGVEKDHAKYVYWLTRAAEQGDRTAKAKLKRLKHS